MCCDCLSTTSPLYPCSFHNTPKYFSPSASHVSFCPLPLYYLILPSLNLLPELFLDLYQHVCIYFLGFFLMNSSRFHWHNFSPKVLRSSGYWTPLPKSWNYVIFMLIKKNTGVPSSLAGIFRENPWQFYLRVVMQNVLSLASAKTSVLLTRHQNIIVSEKLKSCVENL